MKSCETYHNVIGINQVFVVFSDDGMILRGMRKWSIPAADSVVVIHREQHDTVLIDDLRRCLSREDRKRGL